MSFLVDKWPITEIPLLEKQYAEYKKYLESFQGRLPSSALTFATAAWHYDARDHRALHDSWLESLAIREIFEGERMQHRSVEIEMHLLGAYHDGHTTLTYRGVAGYALSLPHRDSGHADLLVDEFSLSANGLLVHEILFSSGGRYSVECRDFDWLWSPFSEVSRVVPA